TRQKKAPAAPPFALVCVHVDRFLVYRLAREPHSAGTQSGQGSDSGRSDDRRHPSHGVAGVRALTAQALDHFGDFRLHGPDIRSLRSWLSRRPLVFVATYRAATGGSGRGHRNLLRNGTLTARRPRASKLRSALIQRSTRSCPYEFQPTIERCLPA